MIKEKYTIAKRIIEESVSVRGDNGTGNFLNIVAKEVYNGKIDFNEFSPESWTRARRKVLENNKHLDYRTNKTKEVEELVKEELGYAV